MTDVLTLGEALVSFRTPAIGPGWAASAHVAGAESNVAIGLARLGHAARWVGRVSDDALGEWVRATLAGEGVDVSHVRTGPGPAGVMVLESPADQSRRATYVRAASAGSRLDAADVLPALEGCRRVHLTGVTAALSASARQACQEVARAARGRGITVSLDVNHRPALWSDGQARAALTPLVPWVEVLIASEDELPLVAPPGVRGEAATIEALLSAGVAEVVVKRGERGALVATASGGVDLPARPVDVVDVIGAGDALCAGYLSGRLDGLPPSAALARGIDVAAACVASPGDWEGLPTRDEL